MERITRKDCERLALTMSGRLGRPYNEYGVEDSLHVSDESSVKRLRAYSGPNGGVRDIGPGFTTWRELHTFLRGMWEYDWELQRS